MLKKFWQEFKPPYGRAVGKNHGFSLIELLIVIGLLGVFTYLGMPHLKPFLQYSSLKKDSWTLLSDLRSYRQLSIIEHNNYRFTFDINSDSYTIEQRDAATDAFIQTIGTINLSNDITSATDTTFRPKGEASAASTIIIKGNNSPDTLTINVYSTTGLAKITES